eukprot:jgi/Ulvmu1/8573/UM045_0015.1
MQCSLTWHRPLAVPQRKCAMQHANRQIPSARRCSSSAKGLTPYKNTSSGKARLQPPRAAPSSDLPSGNYDYIIVGGGLAGCLLANRLSADESKSVLLIEAGEDNKDMIVKVPVGLTRLFKNPTLDWNLETTKQPSMSDREMYLARGKLLGGSSSTNATLYHRGTAADYDSWNLPGWSSDDVLPWFVTMEDNPAFGNSKYHSTGGAMHVEFPIYQNQLFDKHFAAAKEAGLTPNSDFNDWSHPQDGFGEFQVAITNRGRRADSYRQFLSPVLGRPNLTVATRAQVSKVAFETRDGTPTAVGVNIQSINPGAPVRPTGATSSAGLNPGGEVLLTAGAIHSPQVLMASGVGPSSHLEEHGIPVVSDLPGVGSNLQDHPAVLSAFRLSDAAGRVAITDHIYDDDANIRPLQLLNWAVRGKGPLTSTACDRGAFVRTSEDRSQPDLQLRFVAGLALDADAIGSYVAFGKMKAAGEVDRWPTGITYQILAVRPESRGSVRLSSADISQRPAIDVAYLSDPGGADRATLRAGLRLSRKLAQTGAWGGLIEEELHPGAADESDEALDAYIARSMHSGNALVGTCALGDRAAGGVVSPADFSVHGVAGLRVVDSSVMPRIPGGQTGAPTVMIAERAASMLCEGRTSVEGTKPGAAELTMA